MNRIQVVSGQLKPDGSLELAERLDLAPGQVRVTVETVPEPGRSGPDLLEAMNQIRQDQTARGCRGRTVEEMRTEEAEKQAADQEYEER